MPVDIAAAERFIHANARLLERHRLAVLLYGAPVAPVLEALRAYRKLRWRLRPRAGARRARPGQ